MIIVIKMIMKVSNDDLSVPVYLSMNFKFFFLDTHRPSRLVLFPSIRFSVYIDIPDKILEGKCALRRKIR